VVAAGSQYIACRILVVAWLLTVMVSGPATLGPSGRVAGVVLPAANATGADLIPTEVAITLAGVGTVRGCRQQSPVVS